MTVSFSTEKSKAEKLKEFLRKNGVASVREKLADYLRLLREEFSQGLILPTKDAPVAAKVQSSSSINTAKSTSATPSKSNGTPVVELKDVKITDTFKCTKVDLFKAFCDPDRVKAFTQNSVSKYDCKKGGFFSLFSDNITGRFLDLVPYERVDMLWRFKSWPSDHYSHVSLLFQDDTDQTKLLIQQTGVPAQFYENTMVRARIHSRRRPPLRSFRTDGNGSTFKASSQRSATVRDCFRLFQIRVFVFCVSVIDKIKMNLATREPV